VTAAAVVADGPRLDDADAFRALGVALTEAGYSEERLGEIGLLGPVFPDTADSAYHLLAIEGAGRLATLVKLFQLALPVDTRQFAEAVAPLPVERLVHAGLLERDGERVRSTVALAPVLGLLMAWDWETGARLPTRRDHVLAASSTPSRVLAHLAVREPVDSALDVGTGSGLHALLASRHARRVVATDVNPRALRFARLNALLNDAGNVELREGSLFDPVGGERFDLVAANPPYVVSPEHELAFRDSGLPGDSFCEAMVRALPAHLNEGGVAHALVSWAHGADEDSSAPLRAWVEDSGCDALLLYHGSQRPLEYASGENRLRWQDDPEAYRERLEHWLDYYRGLGIERIGWGALVLRRRTGPNGFTTAVAALTACDRAGGHLRRLLDAHDDCARLAGAALLDARLSLHDDVRLDQSVLFRDGEPLLERAMVRLDGGLRLQVELEPHLPGVLAQLDAGRPVGEVVEEVARQVGDRGADADEWAAAALSAIRLLVRSGFLAPREREPA
jgi:methylase of polypeptide subunit release factors